MFEREARKVLQDLLAELGEPPVHVLEPGEIPDLGQLVAGSLVATLVPVDAAELAVLTLQEAGLTDVHALPAGDDILVVGMVPTREALARQDPTPSGPIPHHAEHVPAPTTRSPVPRRSPRLVAGATSSDLDPFRIVSVFPQGERALDQRALVVERGRVRVPTVPALLAFGARPWAFLPGACVLATTHDEAQRFSHPLAELPRAVGAWSAFSDVPPTLAEVLVQLAIFGRDWSEDVEALPITLDTDGKHVTLRFPGLAKNPELPDLLVPQGFDRDPLHRLETRTGRRLRLSTSDGTTSLRIPVPRAPAAPTRRGRYKSRFDRQDIVVAHLMEHGPKSTKELMADLDWTRSTLRNTLAALVEEGRVETTAKGKQAPGQRYFVDVPDR